MTRSRFGQIRTFSFCLQAVIKKGDEKLLSAESAMLFDQFIETAACLTYYFSL